MSNPVLHLLDPRTHIDLPRQSISHIPAGSYRLVNAQSRACLTATAPSFVTSTNTELPLISARRATLPDETTSNHQIWNVVRTPVITKPTPVVNTSPPPPKPSPPLSKPSPTTSTFIIESSDLSATSGAGHAFRLDLEDVPTPITDPTIYSVLDHTPNGLLPPVLRFGTVPTPPTPPPEITLPTVATRKLVASPAGPVTSSFVFIKSHISSRFWLYNPATSLFVGQPTTTVAHPGTTSDGTLVEAGDLKKYFLDTQAYVASKESQKGWATDKSKSLWDTFVKEMNSWMWEFARVDFGPQKGFYRIVHNATLLSLDTPEQSIHQTPRRITESSRRGRRSISSATKTLNFTDLATTAAAEIDPHARSQVWNILPQADTDGKGAIMYSIHNTSKSTVSLSLPDTPNVDTHWRLILVPPKATAAASGPTSATYLIYEIDTGSFLGLSPVDEGIVSIANGLDASELISNVETNDTGEDVLLGWIHQERELFWANWEWLTWKVIEQGWGPEDGVYGIVDSVSSKHLEVPATAHTDPTPVILSTPTVAPLGTTWWNLKAAVADDGTIYYTVHNYRSAAVLDLGATTRKDIVARRLSAPKGEQWAIIRGDEDAKEFDFLKYEIPGTALATTSSGDITLVAVNKSTRSWTLEKVQFHITPGSYFLVNVASNLFLSANTFLPNKPLLARTFTTNDNEQVWNLSTQPGTSDSVFIGASQGDISASVPPKNSVWTSTGNPHEMFVIGVDDNQLRTGWIFTKHEKSNAYKVHDGDGNVLSIVEGSGSKRMVVLTSDSGTDSQLWRAVAFGKLSPAVPIITSPASPTNVPDGLYRIINQHTKLNLVLGQKVKLGRLDHLSSPVGLELRAKAHSYSPYELWYISRNRDPLLAPQDQTYLIQSFASALYIDQSDPDARQRASGLTCWATPRQPLYETQKWVLSQHSAFSFAITSYPTGCLLGVESSNLVSTPQLSATPTPTQMWQLSPVAAPLTSGNYKISNVYTQTAVSVTSSTPSVVCAQYGLLGPVSFKWRLTALSDGLYRIESLNGLACLVAEPSTEVTVRSGGQGLASRWKLRPSTESSFLIENAANGLVLTLKDGSAEMNAPIQLTEAGRDHDNPWQRFAIERLDAPARCFDDVGSDKVTFGLYTILNARSNSMLSFPSGTVAFGARPVCSITTSTSMPTTAPAFWTITPAATGYYSLQQSGMSLGHGVLDASDSRAPFPVALSDGFDATRWKILKCDAGETYRIVNQQTGMLLLEDDKGMVICGVDDGISLGQQWMLSAPIPYPADVPSLSKELHVQNSMFQFINCKTTNCMVSISSTSLPAATTPRDLEPFSVDGRQQVWVVEQDRGGWYIIKSYPFCNALGAGDSGSLVYANDRPSQASFQWKFLQDAKATTVRCVNRRFPMSVLSAQEGSGALELIADNSMPLQRWTMLRVSGLSLDTNIAQGVYTISLYTQPTVSSAIAGINNSAAKSKSDESSFKKLKIIQDSFTNVSMTLRAKFPSPALPTGVDTSVIQAQLAPSDWENSLAATTISATVLGFLYTASLSSPPPPSQSAAGDTTATPASASSLSFDTASTKISMIIGDFLQKSLMANNVSDLDPTTAADSIIQISKTIMLMTDISPKNVQSLIFSLGKAILSQIASIVSSFPEPPSSGKPSTTPAALTLNTFTSVAGVSLSAQDASQYWMLEAVSSSPGLYTISHLTAKQYLVLGTAVSTTSSSLNVLVQMQFPGPEGLWRVVSQRMGGYALINSAHPHQALCLLSGTTQVGCLNYVADLQPGYSQQRWQLNRSGYYLQNQGENNSVKVASVDATGNGVHLIPYPLFSQASLLNGARADAYSIWHLVKVDKGYQFVNEHTRSFLNNTGSNGDTVGATAASPGDNAIWRFAKVGDTNIWMQCQDHGRWLALGDANSNSLCLQDPGNKENWKGWQFVSVARTERGALMSLPRCALVPPTPQDQSLVYSVDPISLKLVQQHYQPDNAYQRFRSVTFGNSTTYVNEATKRVLKHPGSTTDIANIDTDCWFIGSDSRITTVSNTGLAVFQKVVKNTGDMPISLSTYRIQVGGSLPSLPTLVLGVTDSGEPRIVPFDVLDASQLWSYLEWGLGRFLVHVLSSKPLSTASNTTTVILAPGGTFTQEAMWTIDVSTANVPGVNGFFKLRPAIQLTGPSLSLQANSEVLPFGTIPVLSSEGDFGCRFISTSSAFNFTWRRTMLFTFMKSYLPVFVHDKRSPLPVDVESYLSHSKVLDKTRPALPPRSYPPLPTSENGDWVLQSALPISDGKSAIAYVVVRQTTEPIYINYTDFAIWLLYSPTSPVDIAAGWKSITMRVNNDSKLIESVYFPNMGWVYNLDMNFSSLIDRKANPLRIIKGASDAAKLHIFVQPDLTMTPVFPAMTAESDIADQTKWGLLFDSGRSVELLEADMLRDDAQGSKPVRPQWMDYTGKWIDSSGPSAVGPR